MLQFRILMQRIGGDQTMFTTITALCITDAIKEANVIWGTHYRIIHAGKVMK